MPLTLTATITLDDETLAALRTVLTVPGTVTPTPTQPPPVIPVPLPVPPGDLPLQDAYVSAATLRLIITRNAAKLPDAVKLDGVQIHNGFGPGYEYFTWADGTVRREPPANPVRKPGDPLLAEYVDRAALLADASTVQWAWAILLDGEPVQGGFEAVPPASYVTQSSGKVVKQ